MNQSSSFSMNLLRVLKVTRQLGPAAVWHYTRYQIGLRSGFYKWKTRSAPPAGGTGQALLPARFPSRPELDACLDAATRRAILAEADELLAGYYRPYSGLPVQLDLSADSRSENWVRLERRHDWLAGRDIKDIWEPARFSWAFTLGRAWALTGDPRYADAFWQQVETFWAHHPPYHGPQWMNGQEVALRLLAWAWADALFAAAPSSTPGRRRWLAQALAAHADRVALTLTYARAQESNHLMSEAAALWVAGLTLPDHPHARRWLQTGRHWFFWAVYRHIDPQSGEYIHHSVNYHRFILQLALFLHWLDADAFEPKARARLAAAARWLADLVEPRNGNVPNLGSNDGAYIFPLAAGGYRDFRPVAQAAMLAFAGVRVFPPGPWDELATWMGLPLQASQQMQPAFRGRLEWPDVEGRAFLRLAGGNLRLAHADLLHLDVWSRGRNLLLDPGTFRYNAQPPWDNPWPAAVFHNTLTIDGNDQMTRAGRFMYLDWAQTRLLSHEDGALVAETDAWLRVGLRHRRSVHLDGKRLHLEDHLESVTGASAVGEQVARLHFLLADWPFAVQSEPDKLRLQLFLPEGIAELWLPPASVWSLVRGGQLLAGKSADALLRGWYSPTYGIKIPALSLAAEYPIAFLPMVLCTNLYLP